LAQSTDDSETSSSSEHALTSVTWAHLAAQADLELASLRRARVSGVLTPNMPPGAMPAASAASTTAATAMETTVNPFSGGPRRVANYGGGELHDLFTKLARRGWITPRENKSAPLKPPATQL